MSVINESLLCAGCLPGVLSCPDTNKHGTYLYLYYSDVGVLYHV